ncbi:MAG: hypothetical protein JSS49_29700 [Planctomycetes bacterium]|nr:hypothetical protein [Planctomycetota bacterium]
MTQTEGDFVRLAVRLSQVVKSRRVEIRMVGQVASLDNVDSGDLPEEQFVFFRLHRDVVAATFVELQCVGEMHAVTQAVAVEFDAEFWHGGGSTLR